MEGAARLERVEGAEVPQPDPAYHLVVIEVEGLRVCTQRERMGADTDCGVVGDFEGVLPERIRARLVGARQQQSSIGRDLDERIVHGGPTLVVQSKIARDQLVRPAAAEDARPDESGCVRGRGGSSSNRRKYVSTVLAGI